MIHARPDYNRIQDPAGKIGADEPVFLIRAQDKSAPGTLRYWADENIRNDGDPAASQLAEQWADKMEEWQKANRSKPADLLQSAEARHDWQTFDELTDKETEQATEHLLVLLIMGLVGVASTVPKKKPGRCGIPNFYIKPLVSYQEHIQPPTESTT
jgi:hypothetical protein